MLMLQNDILENYFFSSQIKLVTTAITKANTKLPNLFEMPVGSISNIFQTIAPTVPQISEA